MDIPNEHSKESKIAFVQPQDSNEAHVEWKEKADPVNAASIHYESHPEEIADEDAGFSTSVILAMIALATQGNAYEMTLLIPSTTLSYINADLGPDPSYTWIAVSWTLGASILVSVSGRLSDIFGRRYFMLFGAFVSFVGTIVGTTGQSISQMIASGVLFGIGSGIQEMVYSCLLEIVPKKHRILAIGIQATASLPSLCTPLISYAFLAHTSIGWRGAYWFMTAWHGMGFIVVFLWYHPPTFSTKHRGEGVSKLQLLGEMDFVGLFLFTTSCVLFLIGVNFGGRQYPWKSAQVIAPMVVGVALMFVLALWEIYADLKYPLFPPRLFRHVRSFVLVLAVSFVAGMMYYSIQVLWPRQSALLFVPANDPILRGVYANITPFGTWVTALSLVFFCSRVGHERWQLVGFLAVNTAFLGSMASAGVGEKSLAIASVFLVSCTINQPLFVAIAMLSLAIDDQVDIGIGLGVSSTIRLLGGAIATAIYTAILNSTFTSTLPSEISRSVAGTAFEPKNIPALIKAAASGNATALRAVPGITPAILVKSETAVKLAYRHGYMIVYLVAVGLGVIATTCAFFTRSIDKAVKTSDAAVMLENAKEKVTADYGLEAERSE